LRDRGVRYLLPEREHHFAMNVPKVPPRSPRRGRIASAVRIATSQRFIPKPERSRSERVYPQRRTVESAFGRHKWRHGSASGGKSNASREHESHLRVLIHNLMFLAASGEGFKGAARTPTKPEEKPTSPPPRTRPTSSLRPCRSAPSTRVRPLCPQRYVRRCVPRRRLNRRTLPSWRPS